MSNETIMRNMSRTTLPNAAEGHFVIGKDRKITVPASLKRIAMQNDHNVETVTFDCPRFWDGLDMSTMTVYINYLCADKTTGSFRAENLAPDRYQMEKMHFDWVISKNVTMVHGKIAFQVCIKKVDAEGNEQVHWNSDVCKDCYVSESLDCGNEEIEEIYPDVLEQWHRELLAFKDSGEFDGPPGVSPTITVSDISGGHRVTITDVNGVSYFDVMDAYVEMSDAVSALMNNHVYVGTVEPSSGPVLWFNGPDENGSYELNYKNASGTVTNVRPKSETDDLARSHVADKSNPHGLTPPQIGLVRNTAVQTTGKGNAYAATVDGITSPTIGTSFVMAPNVSSAATELTLSVNGLSAKPIARRVGGGHEDFITAHSIGWLQANVPVRVTYDGNRWVVDDVKPKGEDLCGIVQIQNGGTGATSSEQALQMLGAAPSNHSHQSLETSVQTIESYFVNDGVRKLAVLSCDNTDFNTLTGQGIYAGSTGMTNAAINAVSVLEVIPHSADYILQRQTTMSSDGSAPVVYIRYKYAGSSWGNWIRMLSNIVHPDDMGDVLPTGGVKGQIFYKKVSE